MYIDDLLSGLQQLGVGCHWGLDAVYYADDLALLVPSAAALQIMLRFCEMLV